MTQTPQTSIIARIVSWFQKARPNYSQKAMNVQFGVHFEEVGEMLDTLASHSTRTDELLLNARNSIQNLANHLKTCPDDKGIRILRAYRRDFLDALCDQIVTATGCAVAIEDPVDIAGALHEVNRSNWSKFVDGEPQFDHNGKIAKGGNYSAPDLDPFL